MPPVGSFAPSGSALAPSPDPVSSPESSAAPTPEPDAETVLANFLVRMADPAVTYRLKSEMRLGPNREDAAPAARVEQHYDVRGQDFAGFLAVTGHQYQVVGMNDFVRVHVRDGRYYGRDDAGFGMGADLPASVGPNPFVGLAPEDFGVVGRTDDGLFEYEVEPWIGGDPLDPWMQVGVVAGPDAGAMSVLDHETRLTVDAEGIPQRLTSSWRFVTAADATVREGTLAAEYAWFGMYVVINPLDVYNDDVTSHDIRVGDGNDVDDFQPWFQVLPEGETSTTQLTLDFPPEGVLLGIEGAVFFLASEDQGGDLLMDRKVRYGADPPQEVEVPSGETTLVVYYRTCNGHCALLDDPNEWCRMPADLTPESTYELHVDVDDRARASCTLTPIP